MGRMQEAYHQFGVLEWAVATQFFLFLLFLFALSITTWTTLAVGIVSCSLGWLRVVLFLYQLPQCYELVSASLQNTRGITSRYSI